MRIGILTLYYDNSNYGGLLQSYALQKCIADMDASSELISYNIQSGYSKHYSRIKYKCKQVLRRFIPGFRFYNSKVERATKKFENSIPHSHYVECSDLSLLNDKYDAFICGSDQIWNPIGWQPSFFLDFANKPKISYAASVAREPLSPNELLYIDEYTRDFKSLSVREKSTAEFLTKELNRVFNLVPDPTLLLTKEEWENRFPIRAKREKPYIFAYFLGYNEMQRRECINFAKDRGLDIYFVPYMKKESFIWDRKHRKYCTDNYSVDYFIELIRNAELILTDSFHGAVFSCIFEKPFYVLNRQLTGKEKSMNSRIETLFYELKIPHYRMISSVRDVNEYTFSDDEIVNICSNIKKWRTIGIEYLGESLKNL